MKQIALVQHISLEVVEIVNLFMSGNTENFGNRVEGEMLFTIKISFLSNILQKCFHQKK